MDKTLIGCLILGLSFIVISIIKLAKLASRKYDTNTEGTIVEINQTYSYNTMNNTKKLKNSVVVRFKNNKNEWFTETFHDDTSPSMFKQKETIKIRYSSLNPKEFILISPKLKAIYIFFIVLGVLIITFSIFNRIITQ